VRGVQLSSVHPLLSLQATTDPGVQVPSAQVSLLVHELPSSQLAVFREYWQPSVVLQVSFVQVLLSSQAKAVLPEEQLPPEQASPIVQTLPSLQDAVLLLWAQPLLGLHESSVHALLSLQLRLPLPRQAPPTHRSVVVHAFPSLQGLALLV
jgi:hypothetical protein